MAEEIQEAVQIIRVAYDGIEIAMKVGSGGIAAMQKAIDFLKGMLDYEKSLGKTSMRKLLLKGGDLQVLQFKTEDKRKVEKMAKKYGIDPLIARIIRNRDIIDEKEITEYLYGGKEALHNPHLLKDVDKACLLYTSDAADE